MLNGQQKPRLHASKFDIVKQIRENFHLSKRAIKLLVVTVGRDCTEKEFNDLFAKARAEHDALQAKLYLEDTAVLINWRNKKFVERYEKLHFEGLDVVFVSTRYLEWRVMGRISERLDEIRAGHEMHFALWPDKTGKARKRMARLEQALTYFKDLGFDYRKVIKYHHLPATMTPLELECMEREFALAA